MLEDEIKKVLEPFGLNLAKDLKQSLVSKGVVKGGGQETDLADSIKPNITVTDNDVTLTLSMNDYGKYVDKGRRAGKQPPIKSMVAYIKSKGIPVSDVLLKIRQQSAVKNKLNPNSIKRLPFDKSLKPVAFILARKIGQAGTIKRFAYKGAEFFEPVFNDGRVDKLEKDLAKVIGKDIILNIKKTWL